ncbi:MAG: MFS transporter [Firmicutes bacterium]|nr:MFS transporter [Bacillota bacterium]
MIKGDSSFLKFMRLLTLGYVGGTIYCLMYIRYVFYDQMIQLMGCTNAQLGFLTTVSSTTSLCLFLVGPYLADKLDAKRVITFAIGAITVLTFAFAVVCESYKASLVIWFLQPICMMPYWACLIKYINNLGGEDGAGNAFGTYYMINGLSGALGNAIPLAVSTHFGFKGAMVALGLMTAVATVMAALFLKNEKELAKDGIYLKGDEPIRIKYMLDAIKWPGFWILGLGYLFTYTLYSNVSYFNPYLINVIGIDPDASSVYSVIRSYGAMVVAPLGGYMADKVFKSTSTWWIVAFAISAVMFAIPLMFNENSNPTLVSIYSVLPSLVVFALYSVTYSILRELHVNPIVAGTLIGLSGKLSMPVDGVYPAMFGSWIDKYGNQGFTYIFLFLIASCIGGILVALWAKRLDKQCKNGRVMKVGGKIPANAQVAE